MEMQMKGEAEPFIMQKVRLDAGSLIWSILFLPVMGWLADPHGYPQGAFWNYRANTRECIAYGRCDENIFVYKHYSTLDEALLAGAPSCSCDKGVFVYWDNSNLYVMLLISVVHSTIVGMVVKRFSS